MWGTVHGNLSRIHGGGMLVLCETQRMPLVRDMTRLVDDSLSLDYHDMVSFLISEIRGVRLTDKSRSDVPHD